MSRRSLMHLVLTGSCWAAAVVLIVLRLDGAISLGWGWVTAPLWAPFGVSVAVFAGLALFERLRWLQP